MNHPDQLQRHLRLFDATALVVGSMIGSGIFFGLSIMAQWVQTPGLLIGLWIFGGLFTMLGAISCAELAAMYPHAGGQYVFLREACSATITLSLERQLEFPSKNQRRGAPLL